MTVDVTILFFAFRYSLGRKTGAPKIVQEEIMKNIDHVDDYSIIQMLDEIISERGFMNRELEEWKNFEEALIQVLEKREEGNIFE